MNGETFTNSQTSLEATPLVTPSAAPPTTISATEGVHIHPKKNLYPFLRHFFLILCVLLTIALIIFLMHQNGKSLYENGL